MSVTGSVHGVFSPDTTPLCVDESPGIADCITEMDSSSSDDDVSVSHETTVDSIPSELEPDAEERLLEMCPGLKPDYKREIDRELFMEHFTHRSPKISWRDIQCSNIIRRNRRCPISFDHCMIQRCSFRLSYCGSCQIYLCNDPWCSKNVTNCIRCSRSMEFVT